MSTGVPVLGSALVVSEQEDVFAQDVFERHRLVAGFGHLSSDYQLAAHPPSDELRS